MNAKTKTTPNLVRTLRDGAVATIEINRPAQLNALDAATRANLLEALMKANADESTRAVVLTGAGRAFCVGQDLAAVEELVDAHETVAQTYNPIVRAITGMNKPVIAAVNGPAVGAGMGFALACDLVVMADNASFSCAFGRMALVPDSGTSWVLVRRIGHARAFELAVTGRKILPDEARQLGLVNRVVQADAALSEARHWAGELAAGPAKAFTLTKQLFLRAAEADFDTVLDYEAIAQGVAVQSQDHIARRNSFLNKS